MFILVPARRRAKKKRKRGVKLEVELRDVGRIRILKDAEMKRAEELNENMGRTKCCPAVKRASGIGEDQERWEEGGVEKVESEVFADWEQGLLAYCY